MANSIKTQGTRLYFVDQTGSAPVVRRMECPSGVQGLGGAADQVDDTCLEELDASSTPGLRRPGQITVPFILKDDQVAGQSALETMYEGDTPTIGWCVALSNGTGEPTLDSADEMVAPTDRDGWLFNGYVADLNFDIATNEVVRGTLLIQRVGGRTRFYKALV